MTGDLQRYFRRQIEDDVAFDFPFDQDERGDAFAAIRFLVHREVHYFCRRLQGLGKNGVRGVDEWLNKFHSHERCSPASATGAPVAVGSSLKTYRRISYRTSGLTGFCTKC